MQIGIKHFSKPQKNKKDLVKIKNSKRVYSWVTCWRFGSQSGLLSSWGSSRVWVPVWALWIWVLEWPLVEQGGAYTGFMGLWSGWWHGVWSTLHFFVTPLFFPWWNRVWSFPGVEAEEWLLVIFDDDPHSEISGLVCALCQLMVKEKCVIWWMWWSFSSPSHSKATLSLWLE